MTTIYFPKIENLGIINRLDYLFKFATIIGFRTNSLVRN
jgi:hypothetical protein